MDRTRLRVIAQMQRSSQRRGALLGAVSGVRQGRSSALSPDINMHARVGHLSVSCYGGDTCATDAIVTTAGKTA